MFDFLRRIPAMLGLKSKSRTEAPSAARTTAPKAANSNKPNQPRGRGTGRGLTPPGKPKPNANQRRGKR